MCCKSRYQLTIFQKIAHSLSISYPKDVNYLCYLELNPIPGGGGVSLCEPPSHQSNKSNKWNNWTKFITIIELCIPEVFATIISDSGGKFSKRSGVLQGRSMWPSQFINFLEMIDGTMDRQFILAIYKLQLLTFRSVTFSSFFNTAF